MKTFRTTLTAFLGLAVVAALGAADPKPVRTEVIFDHPENFTDAADGQRGSDFGREANLNELRDHLIRRADRFVPEGDKLTVTITDVDLAGEVEPWRTPSHQDIRIIKDIYPPRIQLSFKLTNASGAVVKEGTRKLQDLTFNMNIYPNRNDERVYEKGLLDDWVRQEFGSLKK